MHITLNTFLAFSFEPEAKFGAFFSGGHIEWRDKHLYCQTQTHINKVNVDTGIVATELAKESEELEDDPILTFTTNIEHTITAHKSGLFKLWNASNVLEKQWKCLHKGPVATLCLQNNILLSGGSDGVVRVWDMEHHACIAALKDAVGVINVLTMHNEQIFASGDDGNIVAWENDSVKLIYSGHFSKVTCIMFSNDGEYFVSSGRDKVLILWRLNDSHAVRTVPVYQSIEGIIMLPTNTVIPTGNTIDPDGIVVACAGEKGMISLWDMKTSKELYKQTNSLISPAKTEGSLAVTHLLVDSNDAKRTELALVSVEHNIIIHHTKSFAILKQLIGFSDEILDIAFCGQKNEYTAVATNSNDIKLYCSATMNCQLLVGHTDIVMAVSVAPFNPHLLASSSKDNTVRLWSIGDTSKCIALGMRHSATVSAVCFFNSSFFLFTGSQDNCVKLWDLSALPCVDKRFDKISHVQDLNASYTEIAHSKDINSLAVSPNDKLLASCSQDKTIKLWTENLTLLGVLKGHKRGVWCCRFSPIDQVLVSSSADSTIKLWSITELNCLKTLEGHDASVLRVEFISQGRQLLSCGADGLVKLFDLKTSECVLTLEEHDGRIWSLCMSEDESAFLTGGSDSLLIRWKDVTEDKRLEKLKQLEQETIDEQQLSNYLHQDQLLKAFKLALKLNKPYTVLKITQGVIKKGQNLAETVGGLNNYEKETLLKCASDWNTNSKNCQAAQLVLNILMLQIQAGLFSPTNLAAVIEGNLGYTQRHYKRLTQLQQDLQFIDYTLMCMQPFKA